MRRVIVLTLAVSALVGAVAGPASAKNRRQPKPPPVTFEATGSISVVDHDVWIGGPSSLTEREFLAGCEVPATQGLDAFVVELSEEISKVHADVGLEWPDALRYYDLRMQFYDEDCRRTGLAGFYDWADDGHEEGAFAAGTKYVLVSTTRGALVDFTLTAVEIR